MRVLHQPYSSSAFLKVEELEGGHGDEGEEAGEADQDERAPADQAVLDAVGHIHELRDAVRAPRHRDELVMHRAQLRAYQPLDGPRHRVEVVEPASPAQHLRLLPAQPQKHDCVVCN